MPFAHALSQLSFWVLVYFGLLNGYERRRLVTLVFVDEAPYFTVNTLRSLDWFDQTFDFFLLRKRREKIFQF
jgi:hypothetical protein